MTSIKEIKSAIDSLSPEEYSHLRQWFAERDWNRWDKEIEKDSASGKLDFLIHEAAKEKDQGQVREL